MSAIKQALDQLNKAHPGLLQDFSIKNSIPKVERMSSGVPSLDYILDGGLPLGRIIEIFGPYSSGKSTLCLSFIAKAQKTFPKKRVAFIDMEHSFSAEYAERLGIKLDDMLFSQPDSGEQALKVVEALSKTGEVSIIIVDSVANMTTMAANEKEIDGSANMATLARLLSQQLPRIGREADKSGTIVVFINQLRMNIGQMYGNPETTPGGNALPHNASVRIDIRSKKPEKQDGVEGCPVVIKIKKSKVSPPFRQTELFFKYADNEKGIDPGFDIDQDLMNTAMTRGLIVQSGAWYTYDKLKEKGWPAFFKSLKDKNLIQEIATKLENNPTLYYGKPDTSGESTSTDQANDEQETESGKD